MVYSWNGYKEEDVVNLTPPNKQCTLKILSKHTTGFIQPLDVYGFRIWKNCVRQLSDMVLLTQTDIQLQTRDNILKLQSLVHNQLSAPRYKALFQYAWFSSGYLEACPAAFINPVEFGFHDIRETQRNVCERPPVIKCSWCKQCLCLVDFIVKYHFCDRYYE